MFQFPRFPPLVLCVQTRVTPHDGCRVSPFGHPRIEARSTAPRGFSQSPTSFFGSRRQGIHRWLFVAWNQRCSCSLWSSQGAQSQPGGPTGGAGGGPEGDGRPGAQLRPRRVAGERAGRTFKTEQKIPDLSRPTVGGRHLRRPWGLEVRIASGQLGAPWRRPRPSGRDSRMSSLERR
jgi:hypothetical protein